MALDLIVFFHSQSKSCVAYSEERDPRFQCLGNKEESESVGSNQGKSSISQIRRLVCKETRKRRKKGSLLHCSSTSHLTSFTVLFLLGESDCSDNVLWIISISLIALAIVVSAAVMTFGRMSRFRPVIYGFDDNLRISKLEARLESERQK